MSDHEGGRNNDRASGALRWGVDERRMLRTYLQNGWIDLARLDSARYVDSLANRERCWRRHIDAGKSRVFRQTFRRNCRTWEAEQHRQGARRQQSAPPADNARDANRGVRFADESKTEAKSDTEDGNDDDYNVDTDPDSKCYYCHILI